MKEKMKWNDYDSLPLILDVTDTIYYGLTSAILAVAVTLLISKLGFGMQ